ncbi:hypothetical protein FNF29_04241 [Cafeteria roenbergensis]|uniref:Ubiquitin-like domain-containing protein n=1 Tax=Cafeteria roenbergensis TaxID=33653 RepID=A0A5A8CFN4_CAFRO|nr:hypothetical protein FNF29_04241 [Cafeteria roenbergensis]|eukprot:KAA0151835.1 hypothetical protein FNF29_04241 [Cafeteria roenbergensis]
MSAARIAVRFGRQTWELELPPGSTLEQFQQRVEALTGVPVKGQKLLGPLGRLTATDVVDASAARGKPPLDRGRGRGGGAHEPTPGGCICSWCASR